MGELAKRKRWGAPVCWRKRVTAPHDELACDAEVKLHAGEALNGLCCYLVGMHTCGAIVNLRNNHQLVCPGTCDERAEFLFHCSH